MGETIVIPVKQAELCCVCMDENKTIVPHPCRTCSENSWIVCNECSEKLEKCPVCREIIQNSNDSDTDIPYSNDRYFLINQCLFWLLAIIQVLVVYVCLVYTGKLYYYIICSIHYNTFSLKKMQEYECYHVSKPNFLTNYSKIVSETVIGIIIAATLFGIYRASRICYLKYVTRDRTANNPSTHQQEEV